MDSVQLPVFVEKLIEKLMEMVAVELLVVKEQLVRDVVGSLYNIRTVRRYRSL